MRKVYEKLKTKVVLKCNDIRVLQRYIQEKYPENSRAERVFTLADAVHKIIERNIQDFDEATRVRIRSQVVHKAVFHNSYDIHAGDIFFACLYLGPTHTWNENCIPALTAWVNQQQDILVSPQAIDKLINRLSCLEREIDEDEIYQVLSQVEVGEGQESSVSLVVPSETEWTDLSSPNENLLGYWRRKRVDLFLEDMIGMIGLISAFRLATRKLIEKLPAGEKVIPRLMIASCLLAILVAVQPVESIQTFVSHMIGSRAGLAEKADTTAIGLAGSPNYLPAELRYKAVDEQRIKYFLDSRNSLLADEPYFSTIIKTSRAYDVNPLLLLAITGQEQGFVPRNEEKATLIANNPYNVYYSWQDYNTNIQDSTIIVAQTINALSKNRPQDVYPLAWINRKYAQDQKWWIGVNRCWQEIEKETSPAI